MEVGGGESLLGWVTDRWGAMVPTAEEDDVLDRGVAVPLTPLSISSVGSRLTNSFCSNWTTT